MRKRDTAEIIHKPKRGHYVKITLGDGSAVYADRDSQGRIRYDKPERTPRVMKERIVPALFKEIDDRVFGMSRAG